MKQIKKNTVFSLSIFLTQILPRKIFLMKYVNLSKVFLMVIMFAYLLMAKLDLVKRILSKAMVQYQIEESFLGLLKQYLSKLIFYDNMVGIIEYMSITKKFYF